MKNKIIRQAILSLVISLIYSSTLSQERKDEEIPTISSKIKTLTNLTGWAKNDIGKWIKSFNGIPFGEQTTKIEIAKIIYEGEEYTCLAKFYKHYYYRQYKRQEEHGAEFWLFKTDTVEDIKYNDTIVSTRVYKNVVVSNVFGLFEPIKWNEILVEMKMCFLGTKTNMIFIEPNFFIKYRNSEKLNITQFYFGSLTHNMSIDGFIEYDNFKNNHDCYDKNENKDLNCCYYEISTPIFTNCFKSILE